MAEIILAPNTNNGRPQVRASTLQEKLGFHDVELATEQHDAIVLWLDRNMASVFGGLVDDMAIPWTQDDLTVRLNRSKEWAIAKHGASWWVDPEHMPEWHAALFKKTWERPITSYTKFVVGFVDLTVHATYCTPLVLSVSHDHTAHNKVWWEGGHAEKTFNFEVKSHIKSAGEIIRQIRLYETYTSGERYVVVSPDTRFADILREQGIGFVEYVGG